MLPGGDQLQLSARLVDGVLNVHRGIACVDSLCRVEHEGRSGHCDFEISTNPRNGTGPVLSSLRAVATDGLSRR